MPDYEGKRMEQKCRVEERIENAEVNQKEFPEGAAFCIVLKMVIPVKTGIQLIIF